MTVDFSIQRSNRGILDAGKDILAVLDSLRRNNDIGAYRIGDSAAAGYNLNIIFSSQADADKAKSVIGA